MTTPLVTVLMPAYNAAAYIAEAIGSVLTQTFTDFELLIINDGSTDDTEKIIRSFNDPRIRLINQDNQGVSQTLNNGIGLSLGTYIARFDADDICHPLRLQQQVVFLNQHPGYVLVGSDAEYIDRQGEFVFEFRYRAYTNEEIQALPSHICPFSHPTVMYRKEAVIAAGMYDINAHNFEDHLLWRKMIGVGKVHNISEKLVKYRFNPESVTIDEKWRGKRFNQIKNRALERGAISEAEGEELLQIIRSQDTAKIKKGAYYSLLSKKFLFNNYQPGKARNHIRQLIRTCPLKLQGYLLLGLSFFPGSFLKSIYKIK